jgi:hypothetical protein
MTLLSICQDAANEVGFTAPSSIISNTDNTAVRLLAIANRVGKILAKKNWHELIKTTTQATTASEPQYDLPSDFRSILPDTAWNQTTDQQIFIISPRRWSYEKSAVTSNYFDNFRMLGDDAGPDIGARFTIHPTPDAVETLFYQYYSTNWVNDTSGTIERTAFAADTDVPVFDEDLVTLGVIWRFLKSIGQPYQDEKVDFDRQQEICMAQSGGTEALRTDGNLPLLSNIPETGFG